MTQRVKAVLFDLGGVVIASPFTAITVFEQKHGLKKGTINSIIAQGGYSGAFAKLERNEIKFSQFCTEFEQECQRQGVTISGRELIESMDAYVCEQPLQYSMIHAIQVLREKGVKTCAVTNNWYSEDVDSSISNTHNNNSKKNKHSQPLSRIAQKWLSLQCAFDAFVESRVVGISKPDPQIYHIACEKLGVTNYSEVVFLDDIGRNLKAAQQLGFRTIKVDEKDVTQALKQLEQLVGFPLLMSDDFLAKTRAAKL